MAVRAILLLLFVVALSQPLLAKSNQPGEGAERRSNRMTHTRAVLALSVAPSPEREQFDLDVTAADDRGISVVEIRAGNGDSTRLPAEGRTRLSRSLKIATPREPLEAFVDVAVIDIDGTRGETRRQWFIPLPDLEAEPDPEAARQTLQRLSSHDDNQGPHVPWGTPLSDIVIDAGPWWLRWVDKHGPKPFRYKSTCPANQRVLNPFGAVLECWLAQNPRVANAIVWEELDPNAGAVDAHGKHKGVVTAVAFKDWDLGRKVRLYAAFYWYWKWLEGGPASYQGEVLPEVPSNEVALEDRDGTLTMLGYEDAWARYLHSVAFSLAVEVGGFVPWSMSDYTDLDLKVLFHSSAFYKPGYHGWTSPSGLFRSEVGYAMEGAGLPATPRKNFKFLVDQDVIRPSEYATVGGLARWGRSHIFHTFKIGDVDSGSDAISAESYWQYRGVTPAARVIDATTFVYPFPNAPPFSGFTQGPEHFLRGCVGTSYFLRQALRVVNIPVETYPGNLGQTMHTTAIFYTIGYALSHGDDVNMHQAEALKSTPATPAHRMLLDLPTYWAWFYGPDLPDGTGEPNVGRQPVEMALKYVADVLVTRYCSDQEQGLSHAAGAVAEFFVRKGFALYTVPQLEARNLWGTLKTKAKKLGFCGT